jgi:hypothetical protein
VSLGNCLILNNNWLTKYDSVRLGEFALSLHPEKTRLIEFGRFAAERRKRRGLGKPETFNFLGFTFVCGKTRSGKRFVFRCCLSAIWPQQ